MGLLRREWEQRFSLRRSAFAQPSPAAAPAGTMSAPGHSLNYFLPQSLIPFLICIYICRRRIVSSTRGWGTRPASSNSRLCSTASTRRAAGGKKRGEGDRERSSACAQSLLLWAVSSSACSRSCGGGCAGGFCWRLGRGGGRGGAGHRTPCAASAPLLLIHHRRLPHQQGAPPPPCCIAVQAR